MNRDQRLIELARDKTIHKPEWLCEALAEALHLANQREVRLRTVLRRLAFDKTLAHDRAIDEIGSSSGCFVECMRCFVDEVLRSTETGETPPPVILPPGKGTEP